MQKFVMVSNYLNHHQIPFCNAMKELLRGSFAFLQTEPVEEERLRMGWKEADYPYLVHYYTEPEKGRKLIEQADVVLFPPAPCRCRTAQTARPDAEIHHGSALLRVPVFLCRPAYSTGSAGCSGR